MKIALCAGEYSGDTLGADLIQSLRTLYPTAEFIGVAGPKMQAQGCRSLFPIEKLSVMGILEVLTNLRELLSLRRQVLQYFTDNPPDVFIGIDSPEFNLWVERKLKARGIKTVHYVSPSVWAWRPWRVKKIAQSIDLMLTLFPFESAFYEQHAVPVCYVGHPSADRLPIEYHQARSREKLNIPLDAKVIALLPGSRAMEIQQLCALFLQTAGICFKAAPQLHFILSVAHPGLEDAIAKIKASFANDLPIQMVPGNTYDVIAASDAVLAASGTVTLETLLLNKAMVVAYRMNALNYALAKLLVHVKYCALPNLLAGKMIVPEFIQENATAEHLSASLLQQILEPELARQMQAEYQPIIQLLQQNASEKAAEAIAALLQKK